MYSRRPNLFIGFHGCDESIRQALISHPDKIKKSSEVYDWLGHGFYVWENNYTRALQWAEDKRKRNNLIKPAVLGVLYQLDYCLDFTDTESISLLANYYDLFKSDIEATGRELPRNKDSSKDKNRDQVLRELDCAVIEYMHEKILETIKENKKQHSYSPLKSFDTVRGVFTEGGPIYEGAGIQAKNHIQICIRNLNCIKGFFMPRKEIEFN